MYKVKVSVIIPTYNREGTIKRAIDSVLQQTYRDFELIIVDDGSIDNTAQIINEYGDSRLRYLVSEKRCGANHARNVGIKNANGEYIAFQDSDDFWVKNKLERQMQVFERFPQTDVVWCRYRRFACSGINHIIPNTYLANEAQGEMERMLARQNIIGTPTMIIRKRCFEQIGLFDESIQRFQDWELCIRLAQKFSLYFVDEVLVDAYESEKSITNMSSTLENQLMIIKKHRSFFEKAGGLALQVGHMIELAVAENKLDTFWENLEEPLLLRGIYSYVEKCTSMKKNYAFVQEWIRKGDSEMLINRFFENLPENSVAVYGMGEIGRLLLNILSEKAKKRIAFIIDRNVNILTEYKVITLEQLSRVTEKSIKYIIVTAMTYEAEIKADIEKVTTIPCVSLYDLIREKC